MYFLYFLNQFLVDQKIESQIIIDDNCGHSISPLALEAINNQFKNEDMVLIFTDNNLEFDLGIIVIPNNYSIKEVIISSRSNKPIAYNFVYPTKCIVKS